MPESSPLPDDELKGSTLSRWGAGVALVGIVASMSLPGLLADVALGLSLLGFAVFLFAERDRSDS